MADPEKPDRVEMLAKMNRQFERFVPHNEALGMKLGDLRNAEAWMSLAWDEKLVGNPETGVIHGGVITSLLDACCGAAVFMALPEPTTIATLDLRIDYMKPATPRETVHAHARCFKVTKNVAFVRCVAYHDDEDDPIATGTGTFMLHTTYRRKKQKKPEEQST